MLIADLEALLAKATPGEWEWTGESEPPSDLLVAHGHFQAWGDGLPGFEDDKEFIVKAHNAFPAILTALRAAEEWRDAHDSPWTNNDAPAYWARVNNANAALRKALAALGEGPREGKSE